MSEIFKSLNIADNKGALLELLIEDVFKDLNFTNVKRQKSGSQYGYDVIGYKEKECWKAECKNLSNEAGLEDIAPKLIWHVDSLSIDRFLIVSVNGISNDLSHLLERRIFSFPIEIWYGEFLEKTINESPLALNRLGIQKSELIERQNANPLIFPANDLKFEVYYSKGLPFSYDYFVLNSELIKAYSEIDFRLTAVLENNTNRTFVVQEIIVRTLKFENTSNLRILRQYKQKGNIEPIRLTFIPKQYAGGEVQLNERLLLEVKNNSNEFLELKLSQKCESGYYELIFEINCIEGGKSFSLYSPIFQLHKKSIRNDLAQLCVFGKYYDTPVLKILSSDAKTWQTIKTEFLNTIKYLGPTSNNILHSDNLGKTWTINLLKAKKVKGDNGAEFQINQSRKSKLLIDLEIPIDEPVFTLEDAKRRTAQQLRNS